MNPWAGVTPAIEAELTPILVLLRSKIDPRDLSRTELPVFAAAMQLKRELPQHVAAGCHSAGPIRDGWGTLQDVGGALGIPYRTVHRWATTGHGPGGVPIRAERIGTTWLVNHDDITKAAEHHGHLDD